MSLTSRIQALTAYANEVTGESDTTLADAVATLAEGYGQGGGITLDDIATKSISGTLELPTATYIAADAFNSYTGIIDISAPNVTVINQAAFRYCTGLTEITNTMFPRLAKTNNYYVFADCRNVTRVFLPDTVVGAYCFMNCSSLVNAVISGMADNSGDGNNGYACFSSCSNLEKLDIRQKKVYGASLNNCAKLNTLILRNTSLQTVDNTDVFNNTPFKSDGTGGTLYVPQALISEYEQATNWSTILGYTNNQILPIEGSIYETQYADGTPIE